MTGSKSIALTRSGLRLALVVLLAVAQGSGLAQKLPGGTVPPPGKPKPTTPRSPSRPTLGLIIVLTRPGAAILLNGRNAGNADADGKFEIEAAPGTYRVGVSAGDDVEAFEKVVVLKARQREVVDAALKSKLATVVLGLPRMDGSTITVDGKAVARLVRNQAGGMTVETVAGTPSIVANADDAAKTVTLSRLPTGQHTFRYENAEFEPAEQTIALVPGESRLVSFRPERLASELVVASSPSVSVYLDGALLAQTDQGGALTSRVAPGNHVVRFEKSSFQPYEERRVFAAGASVRVERKLVPALTRVGFGDNFDVGLSQWTAPTAGWSVSRGGLFVANAPAPGLASGIVYDDFVLSFNLTLVNRGGAAWVLRAQDANTYYLFYLSGPDGLFPNQLVMYTVRDGKVDLAAPAAPSARVLSKLDAGEGYYVEIVARGNTFKTQITPTSTGRPEALGTFLDPQSAFASGGFGFRTVAGEQFLVDDCYADPPTN